MNNHPKSKKSHSKSVFIYRSLAVAFIAFYNRAEQSQSIVFFSLYYKLHSARKNKKTMHCEELNASHCPYNSFSFVF